MKDIMHIGGLGMLVFSPLCVHVGGWRVPEFYPRSDVHVSGWRVLEFSPLCDGWMERASILSTL